VDGVSHRAAARRRARSGVDAWRRHHVPRLLASGVTTRVIMARVALLSRLAAGAAFIAAPLTILTGVSTSGCAMLHARTIGPPLETPAPPPRVVPSAREPIDSQPIGASPPVGEVQGQPPAAINPVQTPPAAPAHAPA